MNRLHYDIFNGDADGIFALHQYRLVHPQPQQQLVTGVKRDINLLRKVESIHNAAITVFDISLNSNRSSLVKVLAHGNSIRYFDHHFAGEVPHSEYLLTCIDTSASCCTSLIVNRYLSDAHPLWAICGAFGDNLHQAANDLANRLELTAEETSGLRELGELFNYNGYGTDLDDLHFHPQALYTAVAGFENPFAFIAGSKELRTLREGYRHDLENAQSLQPLIIPGRNRVYMFPDAPWARRVVGVFANMKAREMVESAVATLNENSDGSLRISVRAPLARPEGADDLCKSFPTGGGRTAAAGINALPADQLSLFIDRFNATFSH